MITAPIHEGWIGFYRRVIETDPDGAEIADVAHVAFMSGAHYLWSLLSQCRPEVRDYLITMIKKEMDGFADCIIAAARDEPHGRLQ